LRETELYQHEREKVKKGGCRDDGERGLVEIEIRRGGIRKKDG